MTNNFIKKLKVKPNPIEDVIDTETGEIKQVREIKKTYEFVQVDVAEFRKTFLPMYKILKELPLPAVKVYCYIAENLGIGRDEITIHTGKCSKYCNYRTKRNVYYGINELIKVGFIIKIEETVSTYKVNTQLTYNGKRT